MEENFCILTKPNGRLGLKKKYFLAANKYDMRFINKEDNNKLGRKVVHKSTKKMNRIKIGRFLTFCIKCPQIFTLCTRKLGWQKYIGKFRIISNVIDISSKNIWINKPYYIDNRHKR